MRLSRVALALIAIVALGGAFFTRQLSSPPLPPHLSLRMAPSPAGGGLQVRYFGASTLQVDDGETALMTDGFFSRPGLLELFFRDIAPDGKRIDAALKSGRVSKLDALLVARSHHDHAMDSALVAERTGALLVGSASTANIGRGHGLAGKRMRVVKHGDTLAFGRFTVEVFESPHSPHAQNIGEIEAPLVPPAKASAYKAGASYAFLLRHARASILVHPSANFVPGRYRHVKADAVFLSSALLGKQSEQFAQDYWREVVKATGAKLVVPIHWDDFTRPLDQPLQPMPPLMDAFERGTQRLVRLAEADGVLLRFMPLFEAFDLAGAPGR